MKRLGAEKKVFLATVLFSCIHFVRFYLRGYIEDPDIGSFIILSQRFWSGDVFYDQFFDPKLPHILPVYSLSFLSGSLAGHLLVTLCCIIATGLIISLSGCNAWGGILYICLVIISPGGITGHLAIFANFMIACGYFCLTKYRRAGPGKLFSGYSLGWLLASAFFTGWSIGLRPNYGFALIPISIWFLLRGKLPLRSLSIWIACCIVTFIVPVLLSLKRANISLLDFYEVFSSWNKYFYEETGLPGFLSKIIEMYSHPIGPLSLGLIVIIVVSAVIFSIRKRSIAKVFPFSFALIFLWSSHYISHTYNHYVLMDLLVISLLVSSVVVKNPKTFLMPVVIFFWMILLLSPINPHSSADSLAIENRRAILSWIHSTNPNNIVSPVWLTPVWTTKSEVLTKGIHPEWSVSLLDRNEFKKLPVVQRLKLNPTWDSQCKVWEDRALTLIAPQNIYDKCSFLDFKEVSNFRKYPLKVWIKE